MVRKAPVKKVAPKAPVRKAAPKRSQIRNSGGTTSSFRAGAAYAKRGGSFSLQQMFGFKIARDSSGGQVRSFNKPINIIK